MFTNQRKRVFMKMILGFVKETNNTYDGPMHTIVCVQFTNQYNMSFEDLVARLQLDYETKEIAETLFERGTILGIGRDANRSLYEDDYIIEKLNGKFDVIQYLNKKEASEMLVFGSFNGEQGWQMYDGETFTPVYLYV